MIGCSHIFFIAFTTVYFSLYYSVAFGQCSVSINATGSNHCSGNPIQFNSTVQGKPPYRFSWSGSQSSTLANPQFSFDAFGCGSQNFIVNLTIEDDTGCTAVANFPIDILQRPNLSFNDIFNPTPFNNCDGYDPNNPVFTIEIENNSSNTACIVNYSIDFGNGVIMNGITNSSFPLQYTYQTAGCFDLRITATNTNGCTSIFQQQVINQIAVPGGGLQVFTDAIKCAPKVVPIKIIFGPDNDAQTTYTLCFGDNTPCITLNQPANVTLTPDTIIYHTYNISSCSVLNRQFVDTLKIRNCCLERTITSDAILIYTKPSADFSIPNNPSCLSPQLCFTNSTIPGAYGSACSNTTIYSWDFGDGTTSSITNPCHTYLASGVFSITLIASNLISQNFGCGADTIIKQVCIEEPPLAALEIDTNEGCVNDRFIVTNTSTTTSICSGLHSDWSISPPNPVTPSPTDPPKWETTPDTIDGEISFEIIFFEADDYTICLNESNACAVAPVCTTITVYDKPSIDIDYISNSCGTPYCIIPSANIDGKGLPIDSVKWLIDGQTFAYYPVTLTYTSSPGQVCFSTFGMNSVQVTAWNGCNPTTQSKNFTIDSPPSVEIDSVYHGTLCPGQCDTIIVSGTADTFGWSPSADITCIDTSGNCDTVMVCPTSDTPYRVKGYVRNDTSCSSFIDTTIFVTPSVNIDFTACTKEACEGSLPISLLNCAVPPNGTWSGTHVLNDTFYPVACGTYDLTYTIGSGCGANSDMQFEVHCPPTPDAGEDTPVCLTNSCIILSDLPASPTTGCKWTDSNGDTITEFCIDVYGIGDHTLTYGCVNNHGCANSDELIISVDEPQEADAGPDSIICVGDVITLAVSFKPGAWSTPMFGIIGFNGTDYTYTATSPGTDNLTYTIFPGATCEDADDVAITVHPNPAAAISPDDTTICIGNSVTLDASGGTSFDWSTAENTPSITDNPTATTIYHVTVTDANGCTVTASSTVNVNLLPTADITPAIVSICLGDDTILTASGGTAFVWSTGETTASITVAPITDSTFSVTVTDGCSATASRLVTVNKLPIAVITPAIVEICAGDTTTLTASGGTTYLWNTTDTFDTFHVSPANNTDYSVMVIDDNGCTDTETRTVVVHQLPALSLDPIQAEICENDSITITATADFPVTWSPNVLADGRILPGGMSIRVSPLVGNTCYDVSVVDPSTQCERKDYACITINPRPVAGMTFDSIGCVGESIQFDDNSNLNTGLVYSWDFGDTNRSTDQHPEHSYLFSGTFMVTHIVSYDSTGCEDDTSAIIIIKDTATATFSLDTHSGCGPLTVRISDLSEGDNLEYFWIVRQLPNGPVTFSDTSKPDSIVLHDIQGIDVEYEIKLILRTAYCNTDSMMDTVRVLSKPVAGFGLNTYRGCDSLMISFQNSTSANATGYLWLVDGASLYTGHKPDTSYFHSPPEDSSVYEITLVSDNQCGSDTAAEEITVLSNVSAFFSLSYSPGCQPLEVTLVNHAVGESSIDYDFEDDGWTNAPGTVTHTYYLSGTYEICQFAKGCGFDTACQQVTVWPAPEVDFAVDSPHCANQEICFTNTSPDSLLVSVYTWDFDTFHTDSTKDACHTFFSDGTYQIVLTGTHAHYVSCWGRDTMQLTIHPLPEADFTPRDTFGCAPLQVQFTNSHCEIGEMSYLWRFGDGDSSVDCHPVHSYLSDSAAPYLVRLTVTDLFTGCSNDTATGQILVHPVPTSYFTILNDSACGTPVTLELANLSSGASPPFRWNFGDVDITDSRDTLYHTYLTKGDTVISLAVVNEFGCTDTFSRDFKVIEMQDINFTFFPPYGCEPLNVCFELKPNDATGYLWSFVDTSENPCRTFYNGMDSFSVILSYNDICFDTIYNPASLIVHVTPEANFTWRDSISGVYDGTYYFENRSVNDTAWNWNFGDGTESSEENPMYRFPYNDSFQVTLIVTNGFCHDTILRMIKPDFLGGLFVPNAFTPDAGPEVVRVFKPVGVGLAEYEIEIYSPAGTLLWESDKLENSKPAEGWDGTYNGKSMQQDAYVWKVRAVLENGSVWQGMPNGDGKFYRAGTVTLIR